MESRFHAKHCTRCFTYITWVNSRWSCKVGIRILIWHIKLRLKNLSQKYIISGRGESHQRPGLPDTKFCVLYTSLRSQDKNSNNSLTFSSPALWKQSRNISKLNSYINHVDWFRSRTPFPIIKVEVIAFWSIYTHFCPSTTSSLLQPIQLHFSEAAPSDRSGHCSKKQLLETTPWAPDSWKPQKEVKFIIKPTGGKKCS